MPFSDSGLTDRYEQLRAQALGMWVVRASQLGLALLMDRGLPAWLAAWSRCNHPDISETTKHQDKAGPDTLLPPDCQNEVAVVLAGMALRHQMQVHS